MAAPRASASGVMTLSKFSLFLTPRPPLTTLEAAPRSGRSLFVRDSESHSDCTASAQLSGSLSERTKPSSRTLAL
jgi:hypothetical protein